MSKEYRKFSTEFKTNVFMELFKGEATVNELSAKHVLLPKSIHQCKKQVLENIHHRYGTLKELKISINNYINIPIMPKDYIQLLCIEHLLGLQPRLCKYFRLLHEERKKTHNINCESGLVWENG